MLMALPTPCRMAPCSPPRLYGTRAEEEQLQEVSAVERQLGDLLLRNRVADGGTGRIECHRARLHFDGLGHVAGLQHHVNALNLIDRQRHI